MICSWLHTANEGSSDLDIVEFTQQLKAETFMTSRILVRVLLILVLSLLGCGRKTSDVHFDPKLITGDFQWNRASGQTIKVSLNKHPITESLIPLLNEFTALTGVHVEYNILSEEEYRDKIIIELSSGAGNVDVLMTGPYTSWSYVSANWLEPLDEYLDHSSLTSHQYDAGDFFPSLLAANRWNGQPGYQNYGKGSLWAIPVQVETYILAYRKDWAQELKLQAPRTYPEFYQFAKAMTRSVAGRTVYGFTSRGLGTWPTIATGYISGFGSYGCRDFDEQMNSMIASPRAVEFTSLWMKTIRECGPQARTNNSWYDAKEQFESGRYGMIFDADFFASTYENPAKSRVAGRVAYALPPAGPDGTIRSNIWTWALAINKQSRHKLASWLFIQWATSKEQLRTATLNGNWNPTRQSIWNDPQVLAMAKQWGNYREVVEKNLKAHVQVCWTPQPEIPAVGDRWARALQEIWSGADAREALTQAAKDLEQILVRAKVTAAR